jgi:hypothetical protein
MNPPNLEQAAYPLSIDVVRRPMESSRSSGHAVHQSERSDASEIIIPSSGRHEQGRDRLSLVPSALAEAQPAFLQTHIPLVADHQMI